MQQQSTIGSLVATISFGGEKSEFVCYLVKLSNQTTSAVKEWNLICCQIPDISGIGCCINKRLRFFCLLTHGFLRRTHLYRAWFVSTLFLACLLWINQFKKSFWCKQNLYCQLCFSYALGHFSNLLFFLFTATCSQYV